MILATTTSLIISFFQLFMSPPPVMYAGTEVRILERNLATVIDVAVVTSNTLVFNEPLEPNKEIMLLISYNPNGYLIGPDAIVGTRGDDILVTFDDINYVSFKAFLVDQGITLVMRNAVDVSYDKPQTASKSAPTNVVEIRYLQEEILQEEMVEDNLMVPTLPVIPVPIDPNEKTE